MNDFFARIYELWGTFQTPASTELFDNNLYGNIGLTSVLITLAVLGIYYYVVNSPRYNKGVHWFLLGLVTSFVIAIAGFIWVLEVFNYQGLDDKTIGDYLGFILMVFVIAFVEFFIFSTIIKWGSTNGKHTPF